MAQPLRTQRWYRKKARQHLEGSSVSSQCANAALLGQGWLPEDPPPDDNIDSWHHGPREARGSVSRDLELVALL